MKKIVALLAGGLLAMSAVHADTVVFNNSHLDSSAPWTDSLTLQQFDSAQGTLNSVVFNYGGAMTSIFKIESNDPAATTVTANAVGSLVFGLPMISTLNFANVSAPQSLLATDGKTDFSGTSGFTSLPITATSTGTQTLTSGFGLYTGPSIFGVTVTSTATSSPTSSVTSSTQRPRLRLQTFRLPITLPPPCNESLSQAPWRCWDWDWPAWVSCAAGLHRPDCYNAFNLNQRCDW